MKRGSLAFILTACLLALSCATASGIMLVAELPQVPWLNYTLEVCLFSDKVEYIPDNLPPASGRYYVIRLAGVDGAEINTQDIPSGCELFALKDITKDEYFPFYNYVIRGIGFDKEKAQFSPNPTQKDFDLFFDMPKDTALENLMLAIATPDGKTIEEFSLVEVPWQLKDEDEAAASLSPAAPMP